jgi:hypothetical protein
MILDKNRIFDGFSNLSDGMDAGRNPSLLPPTQCASAENMVFRGGVPRTRPGVRVTWLNFTNPHLYYNSDDTFGGDSFGGFQSESNFQLSAFQGAGYYAPAGRKPACVIALIGGRLYQIIPRPNVSQPGFSTTMEITEIPLDKRNSPTMKKAYVTQADRFCVIQDGQSKPIIYDGVTARRAKPMRCRWARSWRTGWAGWW